MDGYFGGTGKIGTARLVCRRGKWLLHIPMTGDVADCDPFAALNVCGVYPGINILAISCNSASGESIHFSREPSKKKRDHYKRLRQELQMRCTASAWRRIRRIGQRESGMALDVCHCIAMALVCSQLPGTVFVPEDLTEFRSATEKVRVKDRCVLVSWPFYDLRMKIEYKALMYGSTVLIVDPHSTSRKCPVCGHTVKANRDRKHHEFRCGNEKCGFRTNGDPAAAMNLYQMGMRTLLRDAGSKYRHCRSHKPFPSG